MRRRPRSRAGRLPRRGSCSALRHRGRLRHVAHGGDEEGHPLGRRVRAGAKIDRNLFGQFAEHLGHGVYEGIWVGPDSAIPNTRGIRNDVVAALKAHKSAERSLARRLFRGRVSLAQGHRHLTKREPQSQLGRGHRTEHLRHPRIHGLSRPDRRRGVLVGQRRLRHSSGSVRMAGIPDHGAADHPGEGARRQRPSCSLQGELSWHRQ